MLLNFVYLLFEFHQDNVFHKSDEFWQGNLFELDEGYHQDSTISLQGKLNKVDVIYQGVQLQLQ